MKRKIYSVLLSITIILSMMTVMTFSSFAVVVVVEDNTSTAIIAVKSNPSTGYYWEMTDETQDAELIDSTFTSDNPKLVGAPGIDRFKFKISNDKTCYFRIVEMNARTQLPTGRYVDSTMLTGNDNPIEPANFIPAMKLNQKKLTITKNGKIKVSYNKPKVDGKISYQIRRSTDKNFKKNVKKYTTDRTTWTNKKGLKKGTKYYYKVRAKVKMVDETVVYTKWSDVRNTKLHR